MFRLSSKNKVIQHHLRRGEKVYCCEQQNKRRRRHCILYMTSILIVTGLIMIVLSYRFTNVHHHHHDADSGTSSGPNNNMAMILQEYIGVTNHHAKRDEQSSTVVGQHQQQDTVVKQEPRVEVEPQIPAKQESSVMTEGLNDIHIIDDADADADCPFRNSSIYRKVFVYPNYGDVENGWSGSILADNSNNTPPWPWLEFDRLARQAGTSHYDITSTHVQYTTELLVRQVMVHPKSCLRTFNPDEATLFYVPHLPSVEHHQGNVHINNYTTSPYGQAILDILEKNQYNAWEYWFGLTSKYWKRNNGTDHVLVFSEPMHGLYHPKRKRGNYHYIHTQKQLSKSIIISIELSTTFVNMYPNCARKNILLPYPNTNGRWLNGYYTNNNEKIMMVLNNNDNNNNLTTTMVQEQRQRRRRRRPVSQYFSVGLHGTCTKLRKAMTSDYSCSSSFRFLQEQLLPQVVGHDDERHAYGMLLSTFCPCPGGDSPSAKRMFDAIFMGCIPIIISADFVWPFTKEFDSQNNALLLDPNDFSLRFLASDYNTLALDPAQSCQVINATRSLGLQARLDAIPIQEIQRLQQGLQRARNLYSWYQPSKHLVDNPLRQNVLPDGGAAHALVQALAERANGVKWPACEQELNKLLSSSERQEEPKRFKC